jgi:hypothetical protein
VKQGQKIVRVTCADYLEDRIAAGKVSMEGAEISFYARVDGDAWVSMPASAICDSGGAGVPKKIFAYCSDGE